MKTKTLPIWALLLALALPCGALADGNREKPQPSPWGMSAGLSGALLPTWGTFGEVTYKHYAAQYQYFSKGDFLNAWGKNVDLPQEIYTLHGLNLGLFKTLGRYRAGLFVGAQYVDGVVRGKFLRDDPWQECGWFGGACTDSGVNKIYEANRVKTVLFPLKPFLGVHWGWFGLSLSPQFYYYDKRVFWHMELNTQVGVF